MRPTVSVIVPHYNRNALLPALVRNVAEQTYRPIELIIVDDGSDIPPQLTDEIFEGISVKVITLSHSGRPGLVRNAGIENAHGELIAFLDSDDLWVPDKLTRQVEVLSSHKDIGLVHTNREVNRGSSEKYVLRGYDTGKSFELPELLQKNYIFTSSVMSRKFLFNQIMFSNAKSAQDYELWLKLVRKVKFYYIKDKLIVYNRNSSGRVSSNSLNRYRCLIKIFKNELLNSSHKYLKRITNKRLSSFYFKLAKHCCLNNMTSRAGCFLYKSWQVRANPHALAAIAFLRINKRLLSWAFSHVEDD